MKNDFYNLDYFFTNARKLYSNINSFLEFLDVWEKRLEEEWDKHCLIHGDTKLSFELNQSKFTFQRYEEEVAFDDIFGRTIASYWLNWDINKIQRKVKKRKLKPQTIDIRKWFSKMNYFPELLDKEYLTNFTDNKQPIILGYIETSDTYSVLDGNHRLFHRYSKGNFDIQVIILKSDQHLECMSSTFFQTLYKVHSNVVRFMEYAEGDKKSYHFYDI